MYVVPKVLIHIENIFVKKNINTTLIYQTYIFVKLVTGIFQLRAGKIKKKKKKNKWSVEKFGSSISKSDTEMHRVAAQKNTETISYSCVGLAVLQFIINKNGITKTRTFKG